MRANDEKRVLPISIVLVLGAIAAMLLALGCNNDLPVASVLERTRVRRRARRRRRRSGARRGGARRGGVGDLVHRRTDARPPRSTGRSRCAPVGRRRRLRGRAAADRRGQRDAGDGAVHDAGRGDAGKRSAAAHAGRRVRRRDRRRRSERAAADLHRPRREWNARTLHDPRRRPPARRPTATPCWPTTSSSWWARRGIPRPRRPRWRATRATRPADCRSSPRRRRAARPSSRRSASSATATTARRSRPMGATAAQLEELQISNFTTAGKFESSYAAIFATDTRPDADVTVKWEPPAAATVAAGGQVVRVPLRRARPARRPRLDQPRAVPGRAVTNGSTWSSPTHG